MARTAKQVQGDIISLLRNADWESLISGKIYRNGYRPIDSTKEDIIVTHTAGIPDRFQSGIVTINIYVEDMPEGENGRRVEELEKLAQSWVEELIPIQPMGYVFELQETIHSIKDEERPQHFIAIKLKYQFFNQ